MASHLVVARPYAKAIFEYAHECNAIEQWAQFLAIARSVSEDATMALLLRDPTVPADWLSDIYQTAAKEYMGDAQMRLLVLLIEKKRLSALPEISQLFLAFRAESEKTLHAEVIAYDVLSQQQQDAMKASLRTRLKREIQLACRLDQSILGGAIIRAGDIVIDGSLRSRVEKLRQETLR